MRALIVILLAVFSMTAVAQKSSAEKFINKQSKVEGISIQDIEPGSEEFASEFQFEGDDLKEAIEQLEIIRILTADSGATTPALRSDFYSTAKNALQDEDYITLIQVQADDGDNVGIYANQMENGLIREFVLLVQEPYNVTLVYAKGEIDMSNFFSQKLITSMMKDKQGKGCE